MIFGSQTMRTLLTVALLGTVSIAAAGCDKITTESMVEAIYGPDWRSQGLPIQDWSQVRPERKPDVDHLRFTLDVQFPTRGVRLTVGERERVIGFLEYAGIRPGDSVYMMSGTPEGKSATVTSRRGAAVTAILDAHHVKVVPAARIGSLNPPADGIRLVADRYTVSAPADCPDWTDQPNRTYQNLPSSNWSCTTATNLSAMVANPADLVRGREPGPVDGEYGVLAMERYRKGETRQVTLINAGPFEATRQDSSNSSSDSSSSSSGN